jgi:hypothetical protein
LEKPNSDDLSVGCLFDEQGKLAASRDPAEQLKTLWIGVLLPLRRFA